MLSIVARSRARAMPIHGLFPAAALLSCALAACSPSSQDAVGTETAAAPAVIHKALFMARSCDSLLDPKG